MGTPQHWSVSTRRVNALSPCTASGPRLRPPLAWGRRKTGRRLERHTPSDVDGPESASVREHQRHGRRQTGRRIVEGDSLRGIAIFLVLLWHYFAIPAQPPHRWVLSVILVLLRLAWSGVDLFFVLSGFLIGGIRLDARDSTGYFSTFYRRRLFRIVPLYSILCILYAIAVHSGGAQWGGTVGRWLFQRLVHVLVAVALLAPVMTALVFYDLPNGGLVAYVSMPTRADALLAGVFVAMLVRNPHARQSSRTSASGSKSPSRGPARSGIAGPRRLSAHGLTPATWRDLMPSMGETDRDPLSHSCGLCGDAVATNTDETSR